MKILVFGLFVCAATASAATYQPFSALKTAAKAAVSVPARKVVAEPVQAAYSKSVNVGGDVAATVLNSHSEVSPEGYNYGYETSNGIVASSSGNVKKVDNVDTLVAEGQFQYQSPEGPVEVSYVADENGFQPQGAHLPVAPPVPAAILRSLEYIAAHPYTERRRRSPPKNNIAVLAG